jgi:hypothetical protein
MTARWSDPHRLPVAVNGVVRTDWLEVKVGSRSGWVARGYTRLVR